MTHIATRATTLRASPGRRWKCVFAAVLGLAIVYGAGALTPAAAPQETTVRVPVGNVEGLFRLIRPQADGIDYPDFYLLETEVTNRQYQQLLAATKRSKDDSDVLEIVRKRAASDVFSTGDVTYRIEDPESIWKNGQFPAGQGDFPVALLTLDDANEFCRWLSDKHPKLGLFRLPTWNEWMIAAYGRNRKYPWGDDWDAAKVHMSFGLPRAVGFDDNGPKRCEDVTARGAGRTPQGLYGMLGNAAEFIHDSDPTNENYFNLGARWMGGGFTHGPSGDYDRVSPRQDYWGYSHHATLRECDLGFRVLLDPTHDKSLLKRPRLFQQKEKAWMTEER